MLSDISFVNFKGIKMRLTDNEKRQLKGGFGNIEFSVDIGDLSYPKHLILQKKLKEVHVNCDTTVGGTAIWPKNLWQLRATKKICKDMGATLNKGATFRERYKYERDIRK